MILCERLLLAVILSFQVTISYQWNPPSFISNWITITSPVMSNPEFQHGFNELPVKVDVQIKVVNNGVDYIFTGTGTTQRDDDESTNPLGGIVYVYDEQKIVLYPPTDPNIGVAYSGSSTDFNGPTSARGLYSTALVRVRAWKASDFPNPLFALSVPVSDAYTSCFQHKTYNSAIKPDLVVAQVHLPSGMISEGQGNVFLNDTNRDIWTLSGVLFGYDNDQVKLWVPIANEIRPFNGAVFAYGDGFGYFEGVGGYSEDNGTVVLKGYNLDKAFQTTFTHGTNVMGRSVIHFGGTYSLDTALVMVQVRVKQDSVNNPGMVFNGAGSSMAGPVKYSGVVYVYNESSALLYTPSSSNPNGYMVYLGDRWGNGQHPSSERTADVIVTVFSDILCPDPTVANTSHVLTNGLLPGSAVQYTCDCGLYHTSGNITRYCNSTSNWEGDAPTCTITSCADPGDVFNASYTLIGNTATYTCISGSSPVAGDSVRTCQPDGSWSGIPVVCVHVQFIPVISCADPGNVYNATYTFIGDTVTYTCIPGSSPMAGDTVRTCQPDGSWSGIPVVCVVLKNVTAEHVCPDPGNVYNATYNVSGQLVGDKATYACVPPSTIKAGNAERICQAGGTWSGIPLVCEVITCSDPGNVYNATYNLNGSTATYTCISGSSPVAGDTVRTCQPNGSWSGIPVVCVAIHNITAEHVCPDPGNVYNATYNVSGQMLGGKATYACVPPSTIRAGNAERNCQADGTWSGIPLVCEVITCPDPGNVYNATYNMSGQLIGDKANYACVPPSTIKAGNAERICQADGTWSGIPLVCEVITCADPGNVYNANYTLISDTVTYTCISGSSAVAGDTVRTCQSDGSWSGIPVVCVALQNDTEHICPDPGNVYNATYNMSGQLIGDKATYACVPPSTIKAGNAERICQADGTWSGIPLVCEVITCADPGNVYNANYTLISDTVTYTCIPGSSPMAGDSVRTCQSDGSWTGIPVVCVTLQNVTAKHVCPDPGYVYNTTYTLSGQLPGDTATYTCVSPSTIKAGNVERICQADGTWSGIPLVCEVITCADPGDVYNATYSVIGDTATYTCIIGSPVAGNSVRTCQPDGSWSGIPVVCFDIHSDTPESSHMHPVIYTSESLAECIEQTKKILTVEKKSTNAYKRRLTSATDTRPSAFYLGTGGVAVLCSIVLAVIGPDILTIIRNCQNFATIYKTKPKK